MRSPLSDTTRSESVAGMDMLNDMFQRQARRLEAQLYQRAQDLRTIEMTQRQAAHARAQVRQLEQHHLEQAARISQGAKSLQRLQDLIRESILSNNAALGLAEAHERELADLRVELGREAPDALAKLSPLQSEETPSLDQLRQRALGLEYALAETERSAMLQIGVTPPTSVAMSSDCNPLHDLSAVADYAAKATSPSAATPAAAMETSAPAATMGMYDSAAMRGMLQAGTPPGSVAGCRGHMGAAPADGAAYAMRGAGALSGGMCGCHGRPGTAANSMGGAVPQPAMGGLGLGAGGVMACGMGMGSSLGAMGGGIGGIGGSANSSSLPSPMAALSTQSPRRPELPPASAEGVHPQSLRPYAQQLTSCGFGHPPTASPGGVHGQLGGYVQGYGGTAGAVGVAAQYQQLSPTPRLQS